MKIGVPHALTVTNGGIVNITDEVTDFVSSDRSIKATITASFHGVNLNRTNLRVGKVYTAVFKVKKVLGIDWLYLSSGAGVSLSLKYPSTLTRSNDVNYHTLTYTFTATATTVAIKLQGSLIDGQTQGVFLVDAADIFEGYNVFDPSQQNNAALGVQGRLKVSAAPTSGTWELGNKVTMSSPVAGGFLEYVCITAGSPGTWKGSVKYKFN
ncbi:hypothetical protein KEH51_14695 [[Brevibacterium] frigoritolerans]|uniref:Uncharacterized protein n=1 Tax=Peribacillus frigoritolerans TaxID=450367 RepID=A0A941J5J2_9BACI|nr:hypothetical protein [Peribacillus frigoritolerans]